HPPSIQRHCRPSRREKLRGRTLPAYGSSLKLRLLKPLPDGGGSVTYLGNLLRLALPAGTAVVLFADVFVQPCRVPIRMQCHGELLRPGGGENFRIVDGELVRKRLVVL